MGGWFAQYFKEAGHTVKLFDTNRRQAAKIASRLRCETAKTLESAVMDAHAVLVAVPISRTGEILVKASESCRPGATLIEVSSLKAPVLGKLRMMRRDMRLLMIHPLFGPGASSMKGKTILHVPYRSRRAESIALRRLFPEARIFHIAAKAHDRLMAHIMAVPRLVLLSLLEGWRRYEKYPEPVSQRLILLAASTVLSEPPQLFAELLSLNQENRHAVRGFVSVLNRLSRMGPRRLRATFLATRRRRRRVLVMYSEAYRVLESLQKLASLRRRAV